MQEPFLIFVTDPERKDVPISFGLTRIGRASASEIQINDANVSKAHCILIRTEQGVFVYDFSSRNGTFVGREKACGQRLNDGDEIVLGEHWRLLYMEGQQQVWQGASEEKTVPVEKDSRPQKQIFVYVLPWIIAAICGIFAFSSKTTGENVGDLHEQISTIEKEVALRKKQVAEQQGTIAVLQNKIEEQRQQMAQQQLNIDKKKNLLSLTQEQLRLVRKQRDRLLKKWDNAQRNERDPGNKVVSEKEVERIAEKKDTAEKLDEETVDEEEAIGEEETVVEVVKEQEQVKEPQEETVKRAYDLDALMKKLITVLESYAFPTITPKNLQPMLSQLSGTSSLDAAKKMLELIDYSESLNRDLHKNITFLEKRVQQLLDLAKQKQNMSRDDLEKHQRLLELSQKKAEIQKQQQQRLLALQKSIVEDFHRLQDLEMTEYFVKKLNKRDEVRSLAILNALGAAKAEHAIPKLITILSAKNTAIRDKAIATLSQITSLPFSDSKQWKSWWSKQKNK